MKTCKEVAVLLSQDVDGELTAVDKKILQAHLAICDTCRQVLRQLRQMEKALDYMASDNRKEVSLSEDAKTRMNQELHKSMDESNPD
jgi:predicted anti-sigma-YlaC factor YlaD